MSVNAGYRVVKSTTRTNAKGVIYDSKVKTTPVWRCMLYVQGYALVCSLMTLHSPQIPLLFTVRFSHAQLHTATYNRSRALRSQLRCLRFRPLWFMVEKRAKKKDSLNKTMQKISEKRTSMQMRVRRRSLKRENE